MNTKKTMAVTAAGVAAAVIGSAALLGGGTAHGGATPPAPSATEVDVAQVISDTIVDHQPYSGRLEAVDRVEIRPLVSGTIVAVRFKDGALVKKGDPLFDIDPRPYQAEVNRAAAQVAVAQANAQYARTDATRAEGLLGATAIAKRDYDQTMNTASATAAALKAAQAALEFARLNLSYAHIVAPVTGRVSRAELTLGNVVSTGAGAPVLCTLVSISPIYAAFEVDEQTYLRDLGKGSRTAQPVALGLADESGYSRNGSIDSVDNRLDKQSGTIRVRARFDNADGILLPGLYARVKVGSGAAHGAVLIDDAAVGTDQDKKFVLVIDAASRAQYRQIEPGPPCIASGPNRSGMNLAPGAPSARR